MREAVSDETKVLAGSIMTQLTSLPVITNVADTATGGFGRVNGMLYVHSIMYHISCYSTSITNE